jgi:hypothetical protein
MKRRGNEKMWMVSGKKKKRDNKIMMMYICSRFALHPDE